MATTLGCQRGKPCQDNKYTAGSSLLLLQNKNISIIIIIFFIIIICVRMRQGRVIAQRKIGPTPTWRLLEVPGGLSLKNWREVGVG